ncbi:hypothetical protein BGZ63DRAFT_249570 [Mariannaea sp. PMI_226]|nr:hypothetical protein BGZ63DRAFT_249570 [Mariannaea sp. PMI_226]
MEIQRCLVSRGHSSEAGFDGRSRKACVSCRRRKIKCRVDHGVPSCRRCTQVGVQCVFLPRANATTLNISNSRPTADPAIVEPEVQSFDSQVLWRLKRIEDHVGLPDIDDANVQSRSHKQPLIDADADITDDATIKPLSDSIRALKSTCCGHASDKIWDASLIKQLWTTFHDTMFEFHFLPAKRTFSSPAPVLLAAMLYYSSTRSTFGNVELAPDYLSVLCMAISQLCVPPSVIGSRPIEPEKAEEWAFETILGIILAGLLREGMSIETGIWISVAYGLILEHCPPTTTESSLEWHRLFTGLQIVDLEHASVHLSYPVVPIVAPFECLRISPHDHIYRLSHMMHTGLSHFAGRRLPTLWSGLFSEAPALSRTTAAATVPFSGVDAAVIRDWARQLDDWLVSFGAQQDGPASQRRLVIRQYVLHRVLVLSVYLPARGSDLFSGTTPKEQHELLISARDAVKLRLTDESIWASFDLVVITWAALIVIQGVQGGFGEPDDLDNVNLYLTMLCESPVECSGINDMLANRLKQKLEGIQVPPTGDQDLLELDGPFDTSWFIFNQGSLQSDFDLLLYNQ